MPISPTTALAAASGHDLYASWNAERAPREARIRSLWTMTPAQRVAAMYRGDLTYDQLNAWAAARPDEIPLLNDEFWFIAIHSADVAEDVTAFRR